jgi:tricorn protease
MFLPFLTAQLPTPSAPSLVGARSLSLSPDASRLAFSYQGDVWTAPAKGGRAVPVTNHIEMDDNPIWSPDGQYIAFSSNRSGNNDIYIVPSDGGTTKRLTWFSGSDIPSDWSADGKTILLAGKRDSNWAGIMTLDVATGKTKQIFLDMMSVAAPHFTPDGKGILYTRFGFPWTRPRYTGSQASQLWRYDLATGTRTKVADTGFQHLWPSLTAAGRMLCVTVGEKTPSSSPLNQSLGKFVDNVKRTPNVYAVDMKGGQARLTNFVTEGPRFLTVAAKAPVAAFERDGDVFTLDLNGKAEPAKINLTASLDDKTTQEERLILTNGATDFSLSPKGDIAAFVARNEIWTVPVKKGKGPNADDAERLTDWAGLDEQPIWSPDGASLYFVSDRNGPSRLFKIDLKTKKIEPVSSGGNVSSLTYTPDKTRLSYWQNGLDGGLYTVPLTGGTPTKVLSRPGTSSLPYDWSPDGRYLAYMNVMARTASFAYGGTLDLYILDTTTGKTTKVTDISANQTGPKWTLDGKYLLFGSDREGSGLYALALQPEDAVAAEVELKYTKPTAPVKVEIEFTGLTDRIRKLNEVIPFNIEIDAQTGDLWYSSSNGQLYKASYSGENPQQITSGDGVNGFAISGDGNQIALLRNGNLSLLELRRPGYPIAGIGFRADWNHDLKAEHAAAFDEIWRAYNNGFYDPNFHGRDWVAIRERYRKFLPSVGHRNEMATILNEMIGELESSHSEVGAAAGNPASADSAHLGFSYDYSYNGSGIKVKDIPVGSPASFAKSKLSPGDVIQKINGQPAEIGEALYRDVLNNQAGREVTLEVLGSDSKTRTVKYRALAAGAYNSLVIRNILEARRRHVDEKSGGKLAYVHIAGMNETELRNFNQRVWERSLDKDGLIIDVRNNGGGNTSDRIIDVLERAPNAWYQPRDEPAVLGPGQAVSLPIAVLMAETSFSNAEMFPESMRARKLATLVGMPTPGYVIYTSGFNLVDGTTARMPGTGSFTLKGENLEDNGREPDIKVDITPEQFLRGEDPQLDAAIEALLKKAK